MDGKKSNIFMFLALIGMLSACHPLAKAFPTVIPAEKAIPAPSISSNLQPLSTKTTSPSVQISSTPILTKVPTVNVTLAATLPIAKNTGTAFSEPLSYQCLEIAPNLPSDADVKGIILTSGYGETGETTLLDMKKKTSQVIEEPDGTSLLSIQVSPNRKWLAYILFSRIPGKSQLIVANSDGQSKQIIPWRDDWFLIAGWLDNERLLITKRPGEMTFGVLIILNPFTSESKVMIPDYPDMVLPATTYIKWGDFSYSGMIYNSSLSKVLYPHSGTEFNSIVVWDILKHEEIVSIPTSLPITPDPKWSPDGKYIAIVKYYFELSIPYVQKPPKSDLFLVDTSGNVEQLTQFGEYQQASIGYFSWSSDSKYIAFWLNADPSKFSDDRLAVLDITTRRLTNYCIPGSFQNDSRAPIWSPDGRQLLVENFLGDNNRRVILVDILQGFGAQIAVDVSPEGWMVSP